MNKHKKDKEEKGGRARAWTLTEILIAMLVLAVIIGMATQIVKPKRATIAPFVWAGLSNLAKGNSYIVNNSDDYALPKSSASANNQTIEEPYCLQLSDAFSLLGSTVNCKTTCAIAGDNNETCTPAALLQYNFQVTNRVSYSGLNGRWVDNIDRNNNLTKIVAIDIDGGANGNFPKCQAYRNISNTLLTYDLGGSTGINIGKECFLLLVYENGNVVPAPLSLPLYNNGTIVPSSASSTTSSNVNAGICARKDESGTRACQDSSYPFAYDVIEAREPTAADGPSHSCAGANPDDYCRITSVIRSGLSYRDAVCTADPNCANVPPEGSMHANCPIDPARCGANGAKADDAANSPAGWDSRCTDDNPSCIVRPTKPTVMGLRM